jgi:hypothetical protein
MVWKEKQKENNVRPRQAGGTAGSVSRPLVKHAKGSTKVDGHFFIFTIDSCINKAS